METRDAIFGRRSVRKYLDKPIEEDVLQEIIEAAIMAPSGTNTQPWYFVVVKSVTEMEKIREIFKVVGDKFRIFLKERFPNNPEVVNDTSRFIKSLGNANVCVLAFALKASDQIDINNVQAISAAIQNLCLMAYDKGVGSCWMTAPVDAGFGDVLSSQFAPDKGNLIAAVTLGYPATNAKAPRRKEGRYIII